VLFRSQSFKSVAVSHRPEIHLAIRRPWAGLFATDPRISSVLFVERNGRHGGWRGIFRQAKEFRARNFDVVLLGPPSLRAGLVAALARISLRVGHASDGRGWLLNASLAKSPRGSRHYSFDQLDLGLAALAHQPLFQLNIEAAPRSYDLLPRPALVMPNLSDQLVKSDESLLWVVAPGTTYGEAKTWPVEQVKELLNLAHAKAKVRVVLLGDAQASEFVDQLKCESHLQWSSSMDQAGDVVDLTGKTDLAQVVDILRAADGFVGNDSGLMHLAGALGVPTVGVFGSSNPDWTHPLGARTSAVTASGFSCRPCYRKTCYQDVFCLTTVPAQAVFDELVRLKDEKGQKEAVL